jgi:hypothetical protein
MFLPPKLAPQSGLRDTNIIQATKKFGNLFYQNQRHVTLHTPDMTV